MDVNRKISSLYSMQMKEIDLVARQEQLDDISDEVRALSFHAGLGGESNPGEKSWLRSEYLKMLRVAFDSIADEASGTANVAELLEKLRSNSEILDTLHLPLRTGRSVNGMEEWTTLDECFSEIEQSPDNDALSWPAFISFFSFSASPRRRQTPAMPRE